MAAPLVRPVVTSIYEVAGRRVPMPKRMAFATPDLKLALYGIRDDVESAGGSLALSDLFRSYDMQLQAHLDYTSGKKKAFSPPPGGSMHEAGRAFDVDLKALRMPLAKFWEIGKKWGVVPIIGQPNPRLSESWHFERRGSHQRVYDHYAGGKGSNFSSPAAAMAASAIVSLGLAHDRFRGKEQAAQIQSGLIRLGEDGKFNIDGEIGPKSLESMERFHVAGSTLTEQAIALESLLREKYPDEYFDGTADDTEHLL